MRTTIKVIGVVLAIALIAAGVIRWTARSSNDETPSFRTVKVTRGELLVTISATGTVEPEEIVDVGAQVSGQIVSLGNDVAGKTVDYTSRVEKGAVLAKIDDAPYQADVATDEAQVRSSKAGVRLAEANLVELKAKLAQAERDWQRAQKLGPSEALSQASYDSYQSAYECAKANVDVGEATVEQAQVSLAQAETGLWRAKRNLEYCTIASPVNGVIIDRRVNVGQTVAASLSTPSLFLIAKDLTRMQIWVSVNEADIGKVHSGQPVTFTVDAFPGETFKGEVGKVRLNASMTQNVVTYIVEVVANNSDGRLLPYLTASVKFEVNRRRNVLLLPNAALRWQPTAEQIAPQYRQGAASATSGGVQGGRTGVVWAVQGQQARPMQIRLGISNGKMTEVEGEGVNEGMEIVTGVQNAAASPGNATAPSSATTQSDTKNPFLPKPPSSPKGGGGPPPPM
jgi:HlyD family secretion protein